MNIRSMTKKTFCVKNKTHILAKILYLKKKMFQTNIWLWLAPNMSKHISRNRRATIKASWKTVHDKGNQKNVIALNLYIGTNVLVYERWMVMKAWYTVSRPNIFAITYSHCLCMWVKDHTKVNIKLDQILMWRTLLPLMLHYAGTFRGITTFRKCCHSPPFDHDLVWKVRQRSTSKSCKLLMWKLSL